MKLPVILGPTASGKTQLAVEVAKQINGAIISADSRQVYRGMSHGTGKDLEAYCGIPYYLIDIVEAGETYHVAQYQQDFYHALDTILKQGKQPILCGGTGWYIQSVLQGFDYIGVPVNQPLRMTLEPLNTNHLQARLAGLAVPAGFTPDRSTRKRLIRAIEILEWCRFNPPPTSTYPNVSAHIFGLNPSVEMRRQRITERLMQRLEKGFIAEVKGLLDKGIPPEKLIYYGLEYKYATQYLLGELDYEHFFARLNTEIHRFAKRQMTYFRKMEKDGLEIQWLSYGTTDNMVNEIMNKL